MFLSKGWKIIQSDLQGSMEQLMRSAWVECKTGEEFLERKGEIVALSKMASFEHMVGAEIEAFDDKVFPDEERPDEGRNSLED